MVTFEQATILEALKLPWCLDLTRSRCPFAAGITARLEQWPRGLDV